MRREGKLKVMNVELKKAGNELWREEICRIVRK